MYVAISKDLIGTVKNRIETLRSKDIGSIEAVPDIVRVDLNDPTLMGLLWGEHIELKNKIPSEWKFMADTVHVILPVDGGRLHFSFRNTDNKQFECPHIKDCQYGYRENYMNIVAKDTNLPVFAPYIEYKRKLQAITTKWDKVETQVVEFLESCKSLNEAIKLWPDVALYINEDYMDRLGDKAKKKKAAESKALEALKSIDTDLAVSAYVGARFSGAGS
jgi:hypothetical protein